MRAGLFMIAELLAKKKALENTNQTSQTNSHPKTVLEKSSIYLMSQSHDVTYVLPLVEKKIIQCLKLGIPVIVGAETPGDISLDDLIRLISEQIKLEEDPSRIRSHEVTRSLLELLKKHHIPYYPIDVSSQRALEVYEKNIPVQIVENERMEQMSNTILQGVTSLKTNGIMFVVQLGTYHTNRLAAHLTYKLSKNAELNKKTDIVLTRSSASTYELQQDIEAAREANRHDPSHILSLYDQIPCADFTNASQLENYLNKKLNFGGDIGVSQDGDKKQSAEADKKHAPEDNSLARNSLAQKPAEASKSLLLSAGSAGAGAGAGAGVAVANPHSVVSNADAGAVAAAVHAEMVAAAGAGASPGAAVGGGAGASAAVSAGVGVTGVTGAVAGTQTVRSRYARRAR